MQAAGICRERVYERTRQRKIVAVTVYSAGTRKRGVEARLAVKNGRRCAERQQAGRAGETALQSEKCVAGMET